MEKESFRNLKQTSCLVIGLLFVGVAAQAASVQVVCEEDGLYPPNVTIYTGDSVEWVYGSGSHVIANGRPPDVDGDIFNFAIMSVIPDHTEQFLEPMVIPYTDWYGSDPDPVFHYGTITVLPAILFPGPQGLSALYYADDPDDDGNVQLAVAMNNTWVAVYRKNIGTSSEALVSVRSTDGGEFWTESPVVISTYDFVDSVAEEEPAVAVSPAGVIMAAWSSTYDHGGDFGADPDIFTSRSFDGGLNWQPPVAVPTAPFDGTSDDGKPCLTWLAGDGDVLAVWESNFNIYSTAGTDYDIFYARSLDAGATWGSPYVVSSTMNSDSVADRSPAVATDGKGKVVIAWVHEGADDDILCAIST
ncbi:MAG TPA: sialidase family protein, partial [Candidatus Hydrogenedentes bacterium]|nr:sialidase family protein [Candidatus Hydrogenedentota bacterium]